MLRKASNSHLDDVLVLVSLLDVVRWIVGDIFGEVVMELCHAIQLIIESNKEFVEVFELWVQHIIWNELSHFIFSY